MAVRIYSRWLLAWVAGTLGVQSSAYASTISVATKASVDVTNACYFSTVTNVAFGSLANTKTYVSGVGSTITAVNISQADAQGAIGISCTTGSTYTYYADLGQNPTGTSPPRAMTNPAKTSKINYILSAVGYGNTAFPVSTSPGTGTGTGAEAPLQLYVRIPAQTMTGVQQPGLFNDVVTFTVNF